MDRKWQEIELIDKIKGRTETLDERISEVTDLLDELDHMQDGRLENEVVALMHLRDHYHTLRLHIGHMLE